jgi:hypothetical protein
MKGLPMLVIESTLENSFISIAERYGHLVRETLSAVMEETFGGE